MRLIGGNISDTPVKEIADGSAFNVGGGGAPEDKFFSQFNTVWNLQADGEDVLGHPYTLGGNAVFATASPPGNFSGYVRCPSSGAGGDHITATVPMDNLMGIQRYSLGGGGAVEFWYRHTGFTSGQTHAIFSIRNWSGSTPSPSSHGFSFHRYSNNRLYMYNQNSSTIFGGNVSTTPGQDLAADTWHHIRLMWDAGSVYYVHNGSVLGSTSTNGKTTPPTSSLTSATNKWVISLGRESQGLGEVAYECWYAGFRVTIGSSRYDDGGVTPSAEQQALVQDPHPLDGTGYITDT